MKTCESPSSDTCEPSTPHLITGSFTSKTCAVYLYHRKYLHSTSSASSETGRLPKHVFNIFFFFCINSAIGTRYFHLPEIGETHVRYRWLFLSPFSIRLANGSMHSLYIFMNPHTFGSDRHIFVDLLAKTHYWKENIIFPGNYYLTMKYKGTCQNEIKWREAISKTFQSECIMGGHSYI